LSGRTIPHAADDPAAGKADLQQNAHEPAIRL
jgi:hypothetical protein